RLQLPRRPRRLPGLGHPPARRLGPLLPAPPPPPRAPALPRVVARRRLLRRRPGLPARRALPAAPGRHRRHPAPALLAVLRRRARRPGRLRRLLVRLVGGRPEVGRLRPRAAQRAALRRHQRCRLPSRPAQGCGGGELSV
ncbi:hypothetical protein E4U42_000169, partial [Claviceps africana]